VFEYLRGILTDKYSTQSGFYFVVETQGVGYLIETSGLDFITSSEIGSIIKIYTKLIHKEDSMSLCGFINKETRDIFRILTSVSGVGTKMALALLGKFDVCSLVSLVVNEDYKELTLAKGVGTKLAQKIILELRDKLIKANIAPVCNGDCLPDNLACQETISVLQSLGYEYDEIKCAITIVSPKLSDSDNSEELLRETLKKLSV